MTAVQSTYLGWEQPQHAEGCKRPVWEVDIRRQEDAFRHRYGLAYEERPEHSCKDEHCSHGNRFAEVTVRIVCRSCGMAELVTGEHTEDTGCTTTSTRALGFGLQPRRVAGVYLWPGEPHLNVGRAVSDEPYDFLVTAARVDRVTEADVVGQITQWRGKRGGVVWTAAAVPTERGPYGHGLGRIRWARVEEGLKTPTAAARWIAARLADAAAAAEAAPGGEGE